MFCLWMLSVRCVGFEGVEQSSCTVWRRGGGGEGWRSHSPGGGCWIERRWRRCGSVGGIGWERGGSASRVGEKGGVWCVEGLCVGGGTVEGRFVAKAEKGGGGSVVGWGGGGV